MAKKKREFTKEEQPWIGKNTAPGFTIKCDICQSEEVYLDNSLGYSAESGGWGELTLICNLCGARADIYHNY